MKKISILIVCCFLAASSSFAQGFGLGLKGGVNFANTSFSESAVSDIASSRTGFHIGAYAKVMFTSKFGLQPEAYYSIQGSELSALGVVTKINMNYLQVPILFRYNIAGPVNIHAGPQFGILLKSESDDGTTVEDIKDDFKSSDFAIAAGIGVELPMGLGFTARYVKGIADTAGSSSSSEAKNNIFQISVTFQLLGLGD